MKKKKLQSWWGYKLKKAEELKNKKELLKKEKKIFKN